MTQWTLCTEHKFAVTNGECLFCKGDRNLIQVVPLADVHALESRIASALEALDRDGPAYALIASARRALRGKT